MPKRKNTDDPGDWPEGFRYGRDIECGELDYRIVVNLHDRVTAYLGIRRKDDPVRGGRGLFSVSIADRDPSLRQERCFVEVNGGCVYRDTFLCDETPYRVLDDCVLRLPNGADNDFGIYRERFELDVDLTRKVFGATCDELDRFLHSFCIAIEGFDRDPHWRHARTTASKRAENHCDLTNAWIPSHFPFIAIGDTQYFGGHISLYAFYRHIAFLCPEPRIHDGKKESRGFRRTLLDAGADPETLDVIREAAFLSYQSPITWGEANPID
ncbi:MAG: hypothetical protein AAF357_01030 [Verrucomicrobiota bacterium]